MKKFILILMLCVCSMANAEAIKDVAGGSGGTSVHNYLTGLNDGDYQHLTIVEKAIAMVVNYDALYNIFVGKDALLNKTNAINNVALGYEALKALTIGNGNTAIGFNALKDTKVDGNFITAVGYQALKGNTGSGNTGIGANVMRTSTGGANTGVGNSTLNLLVSGEGNSVVGNSALSSLTEGSYNTAIGRAAGLSNGNYGFADSVTDTKMTFIGDNTSRDAVTANTTPFTNSTALGADAKVDKSNQMVFGTSANTENKFYGDMLVDDVALPTTVSVASAITTHAESNATHGCDAIASEAYVTAAIAAIPAADPTYDAKNNTFVGENSLAERDGVYTTNNTAIGYNAISSIVSSSEKNVAVGVNALKIMSVGNRNTAVGYAAGYNTAWGQSSENDADCTLIGYNAHRRADKYINLSNSTAVGANSVFTASNQMVFGNSNVVENKFYGDMLVDDVAMALFTVAEKVIAMGGSSLVDFLAKDLDVAGILTVAGAAIIGTGNDLTVVGDGAGNTTFTTDKATFTGIIDAQAYTLDGSPLPSGGSVDTATITTAIEANDAEIALNIADIITNADDIITNADALAIHAELNNTHGCDAIASETYVNDAIAAIPVSAPDHNDLSGLNDGDYQHLTAAEKVTALAGTVLYDALDNTFVGEDAFMTKLGYDNTVMGKGAMRTSNGNTTHNVAIGKSALQSASGTKNVGVGNFTLQYLGTGANNTAIGYGAGNDLADSDNNTAIGFDALNLTTTGKDNTAIGKGAMAGGTSGSHNIGIGYQSCYNTGQYNVGIGQSAMGANISDSEFNTAIGYGTLATCQSGDNNVAIGYDALKDITTTDNNVGIGHDAGYGTDADFGFSNSITDTKMTFVGTQAARDDGTANSTAFTNGTAIGYNARVDKSNQVVLGDANVTETKINGDLNLPTATVSTGTGTPTFGSNCPAVTTSAPYTWLKIILPDGSTGYIPVYK